jgi:hypothetical protein
MRQEGTHVCEDCGICSQATERLESGMLHNLIGDVQTEFHGKEGRICARSEPPELEEIRDAADVSFRSIRSFVDHCVDISGEGFDEAALGGFARDFDRAMPESDETRKMSNILVF